jgi:outer membrane protein insertion porin family
LRASPLADNVIVTISILRRAVAVSLALCPFGQLHALESFVVRDIRVEGLQRISAGTVFNYLPVKVGDTVTEQGAQEAIRALHKTGFFRDVRLERQGEVLIVSVVERPSIGSVRIVGTKEISEDDLKKGLKELGLAEGRVYNRSLLDRVEQDLRQQYFSRGYYAVLIKATATPVERNRVAITIDVSEGNPARIRQVKIVGDSVFDEDDLLDEFTQGPAPWWAWFSFLSSRDQYSKQKLAGDIERLRNYYQDRGYLEFAIESTQVTITPDKERLYITLNIREGKKYSIRDFKLAGTFVVPEEELKGLVTIKPGQVFSRKQVTETTKKITERLTNAGYAFANVNAIPEIDREKSQVFFTFYIDPGKRTYVRRINFSGNVSTRDYVMRREMRQLEGSWYAADKIQRSKIRLQRLGYFEDVNIATPAVPGTQDQVDMNVTVKERSTGNILFGVGYSDADGILLNASVNQNNLFGTGNELSAAIDTSKSTRNLNIRHTNPYLTQSGISQSFSLYSTKFDAANAGTAAYNSTTQGVGLVYGVPLSEDNRVFLGFDIERVKISTTTTSSQISQDFVAQYGDDNFIYKGTLGWTKDTLDSRIFPTSGLILSLSGEAAIPRSDLQYYKGTAAATGYLPLTEDFTFRAKAEMGYGAGYGDTTELPFYKNFYAGGSTTVRGYKSRSLGPRDSKEPFDPIGGDRRVLANMELLFPLPGATQQDAKSMRLSWFVDGGQVYGPGQTLDLGELRYSTGLAFNWLSPVGPLAFSYAFPLNEKPGDQVERFQFTLGVPLR